MTHVGSAVAVDMVIATMTTPVAEAAVMVVTVTTTEATAAVMIGEEDMTIAEVTIPDKVLSHPLKHILQVENNVLFFRRPEVTVLTLLSRSRRWVRPTR
jgi:hypothetical protein